MAYIYDLTDTWNAGGTTFNAIKMNVTDSASAAGSKLITLQTNGTEHFSVTKAGVGYFSGSLGIGTTTPQKKFVVSAGGANGFEVEPAEGNYNRVISYNRVTSAYTPIYWEGSEHYFFSGSGSERMRIDSAGNVGIGTSSPSYKLDVSGQARLGGSSGYVFGVGTAFAGGQAEAYTVSTTPLGIGTTGSASMQLYTASTERMRITSAGNVGIGTSSPGQKLEVNGNIQSGNGTNQALLQPKQILFYNTSVSEGVIRSADDTSTFTSFGISKATLRFATLDIERMRIDSSGNVGIGTSSPGEKLTVYSASDTYATVRSASQVLAFNAGTGFTGSGATSIYNTSAIPMVFGTNNAERARIDGSGNLLVGVTTSTGNGGISFLPNSSNGAVQIVTNRATTASTSFIMDIRNGNTTVGSISHTNTATAFNTSSDARLKHDIVDAPEASSLIDAIKVRSFKWNTDNSEQRYGMIAQELLEVAPEAVSRPAEPEEMMGVDYSKLVPMLVKEIQSLRARVAQLEGN